MTAQKFDSTLLKADLYDMLDILENVSEELESDDGDIELDEFNNDSDKSDETLPTYDGNKFIPQKANYDLFCDKVSPEEDLDYLVGRITNLICKIEDLDMYDTFFKESK